MPAGCATEGVRRLADICQRLPSDPGAVGELMAALAGTGNASVSTFELLSSGAVGALKDYLHGGWEVLLLLWWAHYGSLAMHGMKLKGAGAVDSVWFSAVLLPHLTQL